MNAKGRLLLVALLFGSALFLPARTANVTIGKVGEEVPDQVSENHGWPQGTLALINHPLRHKGWKIIWGGSAGDMSTFSFTPKSPEDVQTLVHIYAKMVKRGTIHLIPREGATHSFATPIGETDVSILLRIGSPKLVKKWYDQLATDAKGQKAHKGRAFPKPLGTIPPTLQIFVGNKAVDLKKLKVPAHLTVRGVMTPDERKAVEKAPMIKAIDAFISSQPDPKK